MVGEVTLNNCIVELENMEITVLERMDKQSLLVQDIQGWLTVSQLPQHILLDPCIIPPIALHEPNWNCITRIFIGWAWLGQLNIRALRKLKEQWRGQNFDKS